MNLYGFAYTVNFLALAASFWLRPASSRATRAHPPPGRPLKKKLSQPQAPLACKTYLVNLPLCTLHVMEAGTGSPLIMVPATISELENWTSMVQFMSQWFRVYFFELPGHGRSTPFAQKFSTELVAETVAQFADHIGAERFNLMGFSFGGILAMKTFQLLHHRIERVVFIAPCLTRRAVQISPIKRNMSRLFSRLLKTPAFRAFLIQARKNDLSRNLLVNIIRSIGKVEKAIPLDEKISKMGPTTMDVIACELHDILTSEFSRPPVKYQTPCYFAMSIYDPLLDFQTTLDELHYHFENINTVELKFPFHQPPRSFTFDELNRDFGPTVNHFMSAESRNPLL